jgi:hypothetical protein
VSELPSYHDLHVTTATIPRTRLFDLPYGVEVSCTRVSGWQVWSTPDMTRAATLVAGEYDSQGLRLDVDGHVIVDSLTPRVGEPQ